MVDIFTTSGVGAGGGIIGALLTFLGFKSRLDNVDKRLDTLVETVTFKDTCDAKHDSIDKKEDVTEAMFKEIRKDIKTILEKI